MTKKERKDLEEQGFSKEYIDNLVKVLRADGSWTFLFAAEYKQRLPNTPIFLELWPSDRTKRCFECRRYLTDKNRYLVSVVVPRITPPDRRCRHVRWVTYENLSSQFVCEEHKPKPGYSTISSHHRYKGRCGCRSVPDDYEDEFEKAVKYFDGQLIKPMTGAF